MNLDNETYDRWKKNAKFTCKHDPMWEDAFHETIVKLLNATHLNHKVNDDYFFRSLRNTYYILRKREDKYIPESRSASDLFSDQHTDQQQETEDLKLRSQLEDLDLRRLQHAHITLTCLTEYEKQLFLSYYVTGLSLNKISKDLNVPYTRIWLQFETIKEKIKTYEKENKFR